MRAIRHCDAVDESADALIYSTNVLLNCSGGVGGALLARYGSSVQRELHEWLASRGMRHAPQGSVIDLVPAEVPYRHLLHTVPCDGMYDTSATIVRDVLKRSLEICAADPGVQRVALSALATGYGHLPFDDLLPAVAEVIKSPQFDHLHDITLCLQHDDRFQRARELNESLALGLDIADH